MNQDATGLIIAICMAALLIGLGVSHYYGFQAKFFAVVFSILIEALGISLVISVPLAWIEYFKSK